MTEATRQLIDDLFHLGEIKGWLELHQYQLNYGPSIDYSEIHSQGRTYLRTLDELARRYSEQLDVMEHVSATRERLRQVHHI